MSASSSTNDRESGPRPRRADLIRGLLPLALVSALLLIVLASWQRTDALRARAVPDTESYVRAARSANLEEALSNYRTYGYPLVLKMARSDGRFSRLPLLQALAYLFSVLLFWFGVRAYYGSPWMALAAAAPLPWAAITSQVPILRTLEACPVFPLHRHSHHRPRTREIQRPPTARRRSSRVFRSLMIFTERTGVSLVSRAAFQVRFVRPGEIYQPGLVRCQ